MTGRDPDDSLSVCLTVCVIYPGITHWHDEDHTESKQWHEAFGQAGRKQDKLQPICVRNAEQEHKHQHVFVFEAEVLDGSVKCECLF